jgi:hypothetical protein
MKTEKPKFIHAIILITKLPVELFRYVNEYYDFDKGNYYDKIENIIREHKIRQNGFYCSKNSHFKSDFKKENYNNIIQCIFEIPIILETSKRIYKVGSYEGKHILEIFRGGSYISNGEFIIAMILCGYSFQKYGLNCSFKARYKIEYKYFVNFL